MTCSVFRVCLKFYLNQTPDGQKRGITPVLYVNECVWMDENVPLVYKIHLTLSVRRSTDTQTERMKTLDLSSFTPPSWGHSDQKSLNYSYV